ncbi:MAG: DUF4034 domain-containing protein [Sphingobacteriales bacterium]|nr:MAG: DUF4034 domain-containing protein [Sphingobacteriales bacterium]
MKYIAAMVLAFALMPISAEVSSNLSSGEKISAEVNRLWLKQDFEKLDEIEKSILSSNPRTLSGYSVLFLFNNALQHQTEVSIGDPEAWAEMEDSAKDWVRRSPNSSAAHLNVAYTYLGRAWQIRGHGYANTVAAEQWEGFRLYSEKARTYLMEKKEIAQKNPGWHQLMLRIGLNRSVSESEFQAILSQGLEKYPDYTGLILVAIDHFAPKWGGSLPAVRSFVESAVGNLPLSERNMQYAQMYNYIFQEHVKDVKESLVDCKKWVDGNIAYSSKFPSSYNMNWAAFSAVKCGDKGTASKYFALFDEPEIPPWSGWKGAYDEFRKAHAWAAGKL